MSIVDFASPMKWPSRVATSLICAVRSGVAVNGSSPCCCRNVTSMTTMRFQVSSICCFKRHLISFRGQVCSHWSGHLRGVTRRTWSAVQTTPDEFIPRALGIVGIRKEIEIGLCYHSFFDERLKIDDATPIGFLNENDGDGGHLGVLHQC